jgi:hypothetical protein
VTKYVCHDLRVDARLHEDPPCGVLETMDINMPLLPSLVWSDILRAPLTNPDIFSKPAERHFAG